MTSSNLSTDWTHTGFSDEGVYDEFGSSLMLNQDTGSPSVSLGESSSMACDNSHCQEANSEPASELKPNLGLPLEESKGPRDCFMAMEER